MISPRRAAKDTPSSARVVPANVLETFATRTAACGCGSVGRFAERSRSMPFGIAATSHAPADAAAIPLFRSVSERLGERLASPSRPPPRFGVGHAKAAAARAGRARRAPVSAAHASAPYASALASATTSTPPAEKVPEAAPEASSSASRLRNSVSHRAPLCAFSRMATAQPHMYTPLAGISAVHASHALEPSGAAAAAATPGVQVSTYASAPATAATLASRKHALRKKQKQTSCADQTQRNAKVTVQSVCLNGYDPIAATRKDTSASDA